MGRLHVRYIKCCYVSQSSPYIKQAMGPDNQLELNALLKHIKMELTFKLIDTINASG